MPKHKNLGAAGTHANTATGAIGGALWDNEPCDGCAHMGVYESGDACEHRHWALQRSPHMDHKRVMGVPKWRFRRGGDACERRH